MGLRGLHRMSLRIIETDADVAADADALCALCPHLARAYTETGALPLRRRPDGFAELLSAIVSQQVSVASASAIWGRMQEAGLTAPAPASIMTRCAPRRRRRCCKR